MSRVAKLPIHLPIGVEMMVDEKKVQVKGPKGLLTFGLEGEVAVNETTLNNERVFQVTPIIKSRHANVQAGTTRAILNNMVKGVSEGFKIQLDLVGVGYRAQVNGSVINLSLGFSHPVNFKLPPLVCAETPTNTSIVLTSIDKQLLGQVASDIRSYRVPEPYKGKGIKYSDEVIRRKETKKK